MQLGSRGRLINIAARSGGSELASAQIDDTSPLAPNAARTRDAHARVGEAAVGCAMHECVISGHGHDAAPHEVSVVLGPFQCTAYGGAGPWIDATTICVGSALSALRRFAVSLTPSR